MQKLLFFVIALLFLPVSSYCENIPLFTRSSESQVQSLHNKYSKDVSAPQFLAINKNAVSQILASNMKEIELSVPLEGNVNATLRLSEYNVLTPGAVIMAETPEGRVTMPADIPFKCYKGTYNNDMNSMVVICFAENFVKGIMLTDNNSYTISSFEDNLLSLSDNCILYANNKVTAKNDFQCGADMLTQSQETINSMKNFNPDNVTPTFLQANIAVEIDRITYQIYGNSIPNASAYALSLMSVVSAVYNRDINVKIVVPTIHVWTTTDPYTGLSSGDLLDQFRAWWNSNMSATPRTLAHFITRRSDNLGGIAWVGVLCNSVTNGIGYGFSNTYGQINQLPVYSWDVMVVAHEMGHNFGSPHTHSCTWPGGAIDSCYAVEGSCYSGPVVPRVGTIMSYCHLTSAGIDLRLGFGPLPKARIRQGAENAGCMTTAPDELLLSYPRGGETFTTNSQAYIYWGTSLTSNINLEYSTNSGTNWTPIATVPAQNHYYVWTVPYIPTSPTSRIRIFDSANPSVGDTVNSNFTIKILLNGISLVSPGTPTTVQTTSSDTSKVVFSWTSTGTIPGINYKWKIRKGGGPTSSFVSDSNGTATRISVRKSKLDSLAIAFGLSGDSVVCAWSATAYLNSDSISSDVRILILKTNTVGVTTISSVIPTEHKLYTNYPNPFNPTTKIKFEIPKDEFVKITIYDLSGKAVSELVNERLKAGVYETDFNAGYLSSGTYFYKIETNSFVETRKMVLIK